MNSPVAIYGLFSGERCLYVGRTGNVKVRSQAHRLRFRYMSAPPTFRVLKEVSTEDASQAEGDTIRYFRKRGQAELNINLVPRKPSTLRRCSFVVEGVTATEMRKHAAAQNRSVGEWMREAAEEKMSREVAAR